MNANQAPSVLELTSQPTYGFPIDLLENEHEVPKISQRKEKNMDKIKINIKIKIWILCN